jgi:type II secretory pathway component PulM
MEEQTVSEEVSKEAPVVEQEGSTEPQLSAVEIRALEMGWKPKTDFQGDEEDFIDATEFVRRKPLFEKIDHVGKELKETRKALKALQQHHQQVKESEFKAAVEYLKQEKKKALEEGDADKLLEIDDRIAETRAHKAQQDQIQQREAAAPHPSFVSWVNQNGWYSENKELASAADQIGIAYAANNPTMDPDEVLQYVTKRIKKLYPENFTNPNKTRPSAVEGSSNAPSRDTKPRDTFELSDEERKIMNTFIRQGVMTKEDYIRDLKAIKGVK